MYIPDNYDKWLEQERAKDVQTMLEEDEQIPFYEPEEEEE